MRGWRRNLALCLQRLPDEGRTRPPPRPVSTGAAKREARGAEGGPSAGLTAGVRWGSRGRRGGGRPPASEAREGSALSGELEGSPQEMRCGAQPGRGKPARGLHEARGGGTRTVRPRGAAAKALDAPGPARGSGSWSGRGRLGDRVPPRPPRVRRRFECAGAHGGGLGIPRLQSLGPNFPSHTLQQPRPDPGVCSSSKLQRGQRRQRVRGGRGPGRTAPCAAWPCSSAAAQPPPPGRLRGCSTAYLLSEPLAAEGGRRRARAQVLPPLREVRLRC